MVLARKPDSYDSVVQEINSNGGQAFGISADVSDSNSVKSAFEQITKRFPDLPLAAAIFNAGGGLVKKPFLELTEEDFSRSLGSQAYVPILL